MQNIRVGWRLALGLAAILIAAGCVVALVLVQNSATEVAVAEAERTAQISSLLDDLSANGRENMFIVASLLLDSGASAVADAKSKLETNRLANQKTLAQLDHLMVAGEDARMLALVKEKRSNFITARNKMVEVYATGRRDEALDMFHSQVIETVGQYQKALGEVRDYQEERIARSSAAAQASVRACRTALGWGSVVALVIAVAVGFWSTRSVTQPVGAAVTVANAIAADQLDSPIPADRRDEIGQLFAAMARMQGSLLARRNSDRQTIETMTATRHALDVASSAILMVDASGMVRYANQSLSKILATREAALRTVNPQFEARRLTERSFEEQFRSAAGGLPALAQLDRETQATLKLGTLTFALTINPIFGASHERIGSVVTWTDRTDDLIAETELTDVVRAAARGDFSRRLTLAGKEGYFKLMSEGMNTLMETCEAGLGEVVRVLGALAQGDLTQAIDRDFEGSFARLKGDVNQTVTQLQHTVREIRGASDAITVAAREIAQGNNDLSQRTEQQAGSLQETASSVEQLTATVQQNAENARQANQLAIGASDVAVKGGEVVSQVVDTMKSISDSSQRIADIIGVIDSIAFQTNILALNAAVEAARAGEQGRGFAVVATEVRALAQRCAGAAKEIKDLISESVDKVHDGSRLVEVAGRTMKEIVDSVRRVTDIMSEISAASAEQSAGFQQVNSAISQMDQGTQQNAALVEEAAAAAESMRQQADNLTESVGVFKVGASDEFAPEAAARQLAAPSAAPAPAPKRAASERTSDDRGTGARAATKARAAAAPAAAKPMSRGGAKEPQLPKDVAVTSESDDWEEF